VKIVIQNNSRMWGGNEKWAATVAAGLRARGHEVIVSCRPRGPVREAMEARGIPTTSVRPGGYADVARGARFTAWLRRERPDVVLLTSWRTTPWGAFAARRAGVPRTVVRLGIVRRLPERGRAVWPYRGRVDALIVNAPEIREAWLASAPWFPAERVHVVLNGVAPQRRLDDAERASIRAELGLSPDARVVAGAGWMAPRKGFDLLLDAFARAAVDGSELLLVGTGPEEPHLRERARALGVAQRVRWAGERADVPRVLGACDLFVLASRNEGMANVMLEAMSAGTPVAATEVSGVRTALGARGGRPAAGWIVPVDDAPALARAVAEALAGGAQADARAAEASWRADNWFGVERMVQETESVLMETRVPPRTEENAHSRSGDAGTQAENAVRP
jgi:glycosyltransferase involved in cell wall biosynthesis